jgi:biotin synthase
MKRSIAETFRLPLHELLELAHAQQRESFPSATVQLSSLLSIKTGGCPENCAYCPQSAHYDTGVGKEALLPLATVRERALQARENGATRFCMGAAWREVKDGPDFDRVLEMVREVKGLGLEVCCTLGMPGVAPEGSRASRVQSQHRYLPGLLREDHLHEGLR